MSDAVAFLVKSETGKKVVNYLDDFLFAALLRYFCNQQMEMFMKICESIGLPVNKDKTFKASTLLTFLGLLIDTVKQLVCIPIEKVRRAQKLLSEYQNKKKITIHKLQKLCGFLNFLCRAIVPGHAFTRRLYAYTAGTNLKPHHHVKITGEMRSDMNMWLIFLNRPSVYSRLFMDFNYYDATDVDFNTDSSRNFNLGFGGICQNSWMWGQWDEYTKRIEPSIEYLELFALTAGFLLWGQHFANKCIHIFCDNMSVVHMVNNMSSGCKYCMVLIRLLTLESMTWNVRLFAKHVRSESNGPSDALSRLQFAGFFELTKDKNINARADRIPDRIWPISKIWLN